MPPVRTGADLVAVVVSDVLPRHLTNGLGANEIFLIQAAEATSSLSDPPRRFSVMTIDIRMSHSIRTDIMVRDGNCHALL
jgi:hypothetical protein